MTTRVTTNSVTFVRPFVLNELDGEQPAGTYIVETEEELLETVSFRGYRRASTVIHCRAPGGITRFITVNPMALKAALERDARAN
jgi:hypothetical protein